MNSVNNQSPATKNQIQSNKPDIIKNANILQGYLANSFNGGHIKPIAYLPIMAGQRIMEYRIRANLKMLTPKTPVYQKLSATIKTYFVPNSRVWKNAEKFTAQKGGMTEEKIEECPNCGGISLSFNQTEDATNYVIITDTENWRDSWISTYIPRYQTGLTDPETGFYTLPKYSILPFRGFIAIYNDFERNKEYDEAWLENQNDDNSDFQTYLSALENSVDDYKMISPRAKRNNSYYTDYRTELLGQDTQGENPLTEAGQPLINLSEWTKRLAEYRSQSENSQLNDWDIIAKIRGSKKLTEGKVQLLGTRTIGINYQSVTQSAYNINENISKEFQVMGTQGAYSYTEIDIPMFQMQEFNEEGYLHTIITISADSVFETAFNRTELNVKALDQYRPDLKDLKNDVLYEIEKCGTRITSAEELTKVTGYKRKFSEYFKAPNCLNGDLLTAGYYKVNEIDGYFRLPNEMTKYESQRSFQFFEQDDKETATYLPKKIWKDYTDILINENLAIMEEVEEITNEAQQLIELKVKGQNQFLMMGMQTAITELPIDENAKHNFTTWGEE